MSQLKPTRDNGGRNERGQFRPGFTANPHGPIRGVTRRRVTILREQLARNELSALILRKLPMIVRTLNKQLESVQPKNRLRAVDTLIALAEHLENQK